MDKNSHISFVIPAFNCADLVGETVDSIYKDNFEEGDEVIIVDDASTDDTALVVKKLQEKYPGIVLLRHNINKKTAAAARNTAIDASKNDLIFTLDSDNVLVPGSIKKLKEFLFQQNADTAVFGEIWFFRDAMRNITQKWIFHKEITAQDPLSTDITPCPTGNYLFTKKSWLRAGRYFEPTIINQTLDSWTFGVRQLFTGAKMVALPDTHYLHRTGINSHWIRENKNGNVSLAALIAILPFLDRVENDDIEYLFSKEGRFTWFEKLEEHPIKIKNEIINRNASEKIKLPPRKTVPIIIKTFLKKNISLFSKLLYCAKNKAKNTWGKKSLSLPTTREKSFIETLRNKTKALPPPSSKKIESSAENEWMNNIALLRKYMLQKDPRQFLEWDVVVKTMFFGGKEQELAYLQKRSDWPLWKNAIQESPVGDPTKYPSYLDSSGNLIHHAYSLSRFLSDCNVNINEFSSVFEFGGGYGSLTRLFYQLGYTKQYIIFDLPEFTLLQEFFLQSLDLGIRVFRKPSKVSPKQVLLLSKTKDLREQTSLQKINLVIGMWSLSETPMNLRNEILQTIKEPRYYLFAFQGKFNEVDNEKYFSEFAKTHNNYEWKLSPIEHLPGNFYLFGKKHV